MNQENHTLHYGLKSHQQALELASAVCAVLGHGMHGCAMHLLLETASAETQLGTYPDRYDPEGFGLCQFDTIGFNGVKNRTRTKDKLLVSSHFGYDLDKVDARDLEDDPLLSLIFCRLKYRLRPEPIPADLTGRARYWKRFYNSSAGKGTPRHYMAAAQRWLYAPGGLMYRGAYCAGDKK